MGQQFSEPRHHSGVTRSTNTQEDPADQMGQQLSDPSHPVVTRSRNTIIWPGFRLRSGDRVKVTTNDTWYLGEVVAYTMIVLTCALGVNGAGST